MPTENGERRTDNESIMARAATQRCSNHPTRPAFAVCMSCAKPLCQQCATQWDGIWHCAKCLAAKRGSANSGSRVGGWLSLVFCSLLLLYVSARMMVWAGALLSGLF